MAKGEQTRRGSVQQAAPLFNQKGYEGTSLSDLMAATGLQNGGIYRHFSSKQKLAGEAFDYSWSKAVSGRLQGVEEIPNCVDRLKSMIGNFFERRAGLVTGGCPLMNAAIEADDGNRLLRARARKALQNWTFRLSSITAQGIERHQIAPGVQPLKLARLIIGSLEGALLISRPEGNDEPLDSVREYLEECLKHNVRAKEAASKQKKTDCRGELHPRALVQRDACQPKEELVRF